MIARRTVRRKSLALSIGFLTGVICIAFPGATDAASAGPTRCEAISKRPGGWSLIAAPPFTPQPDNIPDHQAWDPPLLNFAVDPIDGDRIFAATFSELVRSDDGGCTWTSVFKLPAVTTEVGMVGCDESTRGLLVIAWRAASPVPGICGRIDSIDIGPTEATHDRVYLQVLVDDRAYDETTRTILFISDDGGQSFDLQPSPDSFDEVTSTYGVGDLVIAPSDPETIYLTCGNNGLANLFVSHDGGITWERKPLPGADRFGGWGVELAISPLDPMEIWDSVVLPGVPVKGGLYHSADGGDSWTALDSPHQGLVSDLAVSQRPDEPARLAITDGANRWYDSPDGGKSWTEFPDLQFTFQPMYTTFGKQERFRFAVSARNLVYRLDTRRKSIAVLKNEVWSGNHYDSQNAVIYTRSGLYMLNGCDGWTSQTPACTMIMRFSGRGT